jgi:hypothetical protein
MEDKDLEIRKYCIEQTLKISGVLCGDIIPVASDIYKFLTDKAKVEEERIVCNPNDGTCPRYNRQTSVSFMKKSSLEYCNMNSCLCPRKPITSHG